MSGGIFVSYRRDSFRHAAGRIYDKLAQHFPAEQIFMDVDTIEPGIDFVEVLGDRIGSCDVLVVIITPLWLDARATNGHRRLEDAKDFVRTEISAALARNIRVVPILIGGATIPAETELPEPLKPLARRHAVVVNHSTFRRDMDALVAILAKDVQPLKRGWLRSLLGGSSRRN